MKILICGGGPLVVPDQNCPNAAAHEPQPVGYVAWHEWAAKMARTHTQHRCDGCGRWNVWVVRWDEVGGQHAPSPRNARKDTGQ